MSHVEITVIAPPPLVQLTLGMDEVGYLVGLLQNYSGLGDEPQQDMDIRTELFEALVDTRGL